MDPQRSCASKTSPGMSALGTAPPRAPRVPPWGCSVVWGERRTVSGTQGTGEPPAPADPVSGAQTNLSPKSRLFPGTRAPRTLQRSQTGLWLQLLFPGSGP